MLDLCPKGYPISYGTQRHFRLDKGFGRRTAKRTQIVGKTPFFGMKKGFRMIPEALPAEKYIFRLLEDIVDVCDIITRHDVAFLSSPP